MVLERHISLYKKKAFFSSAQDESYPKFDVPSESMSLTERIKLFGKIKLLFICDENLGRSPMLEAAMKKRLKNSGLSRFVEASSAGTNVLKKESTKKFKGKAHPRVRREMRIVHKINIENHKAKQLEEKMITPNTIAVVLNDPSKLQDYVKKKSWLVIGHKTNDPYEENLSLGTALGEYNEVVWSLAYGLFFSLEDALNSNNIETFRLHWQSNIIE